MGVGYVAMTFIALIVGGLSFAFYLKGADRKESKEPTTGFWCDGVGRCYTSKRSCEDKWSAGCEHSPRVACYTARHVLKNETVENCYTDVRDCSSGATSRRFDANYERVSDCWIKEP